MEKILAPVRSSWSGNGVSIISDGWTDTANRPLVNIIVMSPASPYFLRAIDASGEEKTIEWIAEFFLVKFRTNQVCGAFKYCASYNK